MKQLTKISAEQVMNTDPATASTGQSLSQIKNLMEEEQARAVPVVDEKQRFKGVVGYRDLIRYVQFNPDQTKLEKVMHQPPVFEASNNLVELADLRINSGRKLLVNLEGKKLKGVIGDKEFAEALVTAKEMQDIQTDALETHDLETVYEDDSLEKARHMMLDENISRLPVLDENGNLTGIVRSTDMLRMMIPIESQDSGGTKGDRSGTPEVKIAGGDEKKRMSEITVDQLMTRQVTTSDENMTGSEALELMVEQDSYEIIFVDGNYPETILTLKDFIDYTSDFAVGNTVLVNLSGVDVTEEKAAIHDQIKKQLQGSLGRKLERPEELSLHVRKAEKDGKKHRYEIDLKLYSEYGLTTINEEGWELLDVVDAALNELNKVVRKKKEERSEHRR